MSRGECRDRSLADEGRRRIEWAEAGMPVLSAIRRRWERERPLAGVRIAACLHVTAETANLMRTLQAGGAEVALCASNPLSTQDDVAAALNEVYGVTTYAIRGESEDVYYRHLEQVVAIEPMLAIDDGGDLTHLLHTRHAGLLANMKGGMEETTTGVIRLKAMEKAGALKLPMVAVNDARTKHMFDNRYGTGQSTIDGIMRATNSLIAGSTFVVAGYGWCGRGIAARARGMGADVVVVEVDPLRALEAVMDGYRVMPMAEAAAIGDFFVTATGNWRVVAREHMTRMKDGAILANSGHFDVEIDLEGLAEMAIDSRVVRPYVREYRLADGRRLRVLAEGRLVNLGAAEGHPPQVMDMSFANQALCAAWFMEQSAPLAPGVLPVPESIDREVARLKLESLGVKIDRMSEEQARYAASYHLGT